MKILISDYQEIMEKDYGLTVQQIRSILPNAQILIHPFEDKEKLYTEMEDVDGLITAFLPINQELFQHASKLKYISISAVGYDNVDLMAAKKYNVGVCHVENYCTEEVAEHTMSLILALNRNLKYYTEKIEKEYEWRFDSISGGKPLSNQKIAIFGFGRIGKRVAELANSFGMELMAVDPYADATDAWKRNVRLVTEKVAFEEADIITNHMNLTSNNYRYFNQEAFRLMKKSPLFINVGRGACVDEGALIQALDMGRIRGAGLDVLEEEEPKLERSPFVGRNNVILTPHSAFYSDESLAKLQIISGLNLAYYFTGEIAKIHKVVST